MSRILQACVDQAGAPQEVPAEGTHLLLSPAHCLGLNGLGNMVLSAVLGWVWSEEQWSYGSLSLIPSQQCFSTLLSSVSQLLLFYRKIND